MKKILTKNTDQFLSFTALIIIAGLSITLLLTSCAPVSQSVSKLNGGSANTETLFHSPDLNKNPDRKKPVPIELSSSFYPILISEDKSQDLPSVSTYLIDDNTSIYDLVREGKIEIESKLLSESDKIYIVLVLKLNERETANIELNHFVPYLHKMEDDKFELVIENHMSNDSVILERKQVENKIKESLAKIHIYSNKDLKEDKIIQLASSIPDRTSLDKRKIAITSLSSDSSDSKKEKN